jgi:uncharacterized membrane-anchored protein YhcB (DUF1043 family)
MFKNKEVQKKAMTYLIIGLVVGLALGYFIFDVMDPIDSEDYNLNVDDNDAFTQETGTVEVTVVESSNGGN